MRRSQPDIVKYNDVVYLYHSNSCNLPNFAQHGSGYLRHSDLPSPTNQRQHLAKALCR